MSILLPPNALPPDVPSVVANLPLESIELIMFCTLRAVRLQPSHVPRKIDEFKIEGLQLAKTSDEKSVSEVQSLKARYMLLAFGNGVLNDVSPLDCHASVKLTLAAAVPSFAPAGNVVRDEQPFHADVKFWPLFMSVVLKSLSDVQFCHAKLAYTAKGNSELKL
jgi:hypothetical protein